MGNKKSTTKEGLSINPKLLPRDQKMEFKGFEKSSFIEWTGKAVSVVFVGECNFRCPFCQNKDLVLNPGKIPSIEGKEVLEYLKSKRRWLDGLVITGGEPTLHSSLPNFSKKVKDARFELAIETNGTNPEVLRELIKENLVDYFFLDIKAPLNWKKYKKTIGVDNKNLFENIKESIEILQKSDVDYEFRTTVVPGLINEKELMEISEQIKEKTENYYLQQFMPQNTLSEKYESLEPLPNDKLVSIKNRIKDNFKNCEIRNL